MLFCLQLRTPTHAQSNSDNSLLILNQACQASIQDIFLIIIILYSSLYQTPQDGIIGISVTSNVNNLQPVANEINSDTFTNLDFSTVHSK